MTIQRVENEPARSRGRTPALRAVDSSTSVDHDRGAHRGCAGCTAGAERRTPGDRPDYPLPGSPGWRASDSAAALPWPLTGRIVCRRITAKVSRRRANPPVQRGTGSPKFNSYNTFRRSLCLVSATKWALQVKSRFQVISMPDKQVDQLAALVWRNCLTAAITSEWFRCRSWNR
jgi:hypothetical protein